MLLITVGIKVSTHEGKALTLVGDRGPETPDMLEKYLVCLSMATQLELAGVFGTVMPYYDKKQM